MSIANMFGDLHSIDIIAETKNKEILLMLVCNGFIDGSPETKTALLDKMRGYLHYTQSKEFKEKYPDWPVILRVTFTEVPDQLILQLLYKCYDWTDDLGVSLEIEIDGKKVQLVQ